MEGAMANDLNPTRGPGFVHRDQDGLFDGMPSRILLYSHDSYGLGHLRRSLAIASALTARDEQCNILLVTGSPCATHFDSPSRCDILKLPAVSKDEAGIYIPRSLSGCVSKTVELRRRLILESFRSFDPHLVLVDHQLTGLHGEVLDVLREARERGKKLVYGMRDVLDAPTAVAQSWSTLDHRWALTQAYDRICVYGTPEVFDSREHYPALNSVHDKIEFTGYIVNPQQGTVRQAIPSFRKRVLVTVGGGEDGFQRIESYIDALLLQPAYWDSHVVTGPLMDPADVRHFKRKVYRNGLADQVRITRFHQNLPRLLQDSDAVVSMAGYNTCAEIMQSGVPAVLLPRIQPRKEQLIRARRLEELGIAQCVTGDVPTLIRHAVEQALERPVLSGPTPSISGLERVGDIISRLLQASSVPTVFHSKDRLRFAAE
jgi:predicted glycosyltransferase